MKKGSSTVEVLPQRLAALRPAKALSCHGTLLVTSLDFDDSGRFLLSAGVDRLVQLYDCHRGVRLKDVPLKKYGAHLARFAYATDRSCLHASTNGGDHQIRHLLLELKAYVRYFRGHKEQVVALEVSPVSETFLSASADHTVKTWDQRSVPPTGSLSVGDAAAVAYDPFGIVFCVVTSPRGNSGTVSLYDVGSFERGPFLTAHVPTEGPEHWTKAEFLNNGKHILISTDSRHHYVVDAFLGKVVRTLDTGAAGWLRYAYLASGSSCFSPCGRYVVAGMPGSVGFFDLVEKEPFAQIESPGTPKIVAFNPKLLALTSADSHVVLWTPSD